MFKRLSGTFIRFEFIFDIIRRNAFGTVGSNFQISGRSFDWTTRVSTQWAQIFTMYIDQGFLTLLEVLNPASFISAFTEPFVIGKIKYDFLKT